MTVAVYSSHILSFQNTTTVTRTTIPQFWLRFLLFSFSLRFGGLTIFDVMFLKMPPLHVFETWEQAKKALEALDNARIALSLSKCMQGAVEHFKIRNGPTSSYSVLQRWLKRPKPAIVKTQSGFVLRLHQCRIARSRERNKLNLFWGFLHSVKRTGTLGGNRWMTLQ